MLYLLPVKLLAGGLLGSFRGGEIFTTGNTVLTRVIWASLLSVLVLAGHALSLVLLAQAVALGIALFVMMLIPHAYAQNGSTKDDFEMVEVGLARGAILSLAMYWFTGLPALLIIPAMMFVQPISYVVGWSVMTSSVPLLDGSTKIAEFIWGLGLTLALCAACGL